MAKVRGIRGATTADSNTKESILGATRELLEQLIEANDMDPDDVASATFTTTRDLNAEFPAVAARQIGWDNVALMCGHEMDVPDGQPQCIRVMILINTDRPVQDIQNVYLRNAKGLRSRGTEQE